MGRVTRWLKGLISGGAGGERKKEKKKEKWNAKSSTGGGRGSSFAFDGDGDEKNRHAIAIAAATAFAAEAAVTAAQAAAAVVRLTNGRGNVASGRRNQDWAAVKIQAVFRGYLARRALKALKGLVKLQALVRGHIVRKQAVETLRCMQALVRAQSRARAVHAHSEKSPPIKGPSRHHHTRNGSRTKNMDAIEPNLLQSSGWNWLDCCMEERYWDSMETLSRTGMMTEDEKNEMIDAGKIHFNSKLRSKNYHQSASNSSFTSEQYSRSYITIHDSPSKDSTVAQHSIPSPPSVNMQKQSLSPPRLVQRQSLSPPEADDLCQSPHFYSASSWVGSSRRGPFTPKSECCQSYFNGYSDHPNYMSNTESFKAKVRSSSAPRQRPAELEKTVSVKRCSGHGYGSGDLSSSSQSSSLHTKFTRKAYPGSGRLRRMYMPVRTQ